MWSFLGIGIGKAADSNPAFTYSGINLEQLQIIRSGLQLLAVYMTSMYDIFVSSV